MFNKYTSAKGKTVLANDKVYRLFYRHKGYLPTGSNKAASTPPVDAVESGNPHTEYTRAWYMHELDILGIDYRQNARLEVLENLYNERE